MNLTIDRSTWRCGSDGIHRRGHGITRLRNEQGFMCCLGHVASQCGVSFGDLFNFGEPYEMRFNDCLDGVLVDCDLGRTRNSALSKDAIAINDNDDIDDQSRETQLTELFSAHGHELTFVGEYAK